MLKYRIHKIIFIYKVHHVQDASFNLVRIVKLIKHNKKKITNIIDLEKRSVNTLGENQIKNYKIKKIIKTHYF